MSRSVLVIDDEKSIRESLQGALSDEGYRVILASSGPEGLKRVSADKPDIVLLDIWMPDMDGIEVLKSIKSDFPAQAVIMMSGHGTIDTAVRSTKLGAYDFVEKPLSLEKILVLIKNALSTQDLALENQALRKQVKRQHLMVGESRRMREIKELVKQVAPTTGSVLITGENGTGKELIANSIHMLSPRYNKPFVVVNCAAIPEALIESELFGHERGAFTGATSKRRGKFDVANGGTLFLDEIGDMSMNTQAKILRIIQEQKFERVGGNDTIKVDVRLVAATNKDLKESIKRSTFREDLFYRLNVIPFQIPPLRERKEDIPVLARHFIAESALAHNKNIRDVTRDGIEVLVSYSWPGNVRELKNFVERLMILTTEAENGEPINAAKLLEHLDREAGIEGATAATAASDRIELFSHANLKEARQNFEKEFILRTLKEHDWNISKTAASLGVERSHLHKKIKTYGIEESPT